MAYKEFTGELDAPKFREFDGELDKPVRQESSFIDRAIETAKEVGNALLGRDPNQTVRNGRSVLEDYTPTAQDKQSDVDRRLSYGAGPISSQTAAQADLVRSNMAKTDSPTVKKVAKAMDEQGVASIGQRLTSAKAKEDAQSIDWNSEENSDRRKRFADENPMMGALASGAASSLAGAINIPSVAADFLNQTAVNPVLKAFGLPELERAPKMVGTDTLTKTARDFMPKEGREAMGSAWNRDDFAQWLGVKLSANAMPMAQSLAAAFAPPLRAALLPAMGGTAAGQSYVEGDDSRVAVAKGAIEFATEKLPLQAFDKIGDVLKSMGPSKSSAVLALAGQRLLQSGGTITANGLTNAIEESAAQLGGNALDKYFQGKDVELTNGLAESAVIGAATGKAMSAPQVAAIASGKYDSTETQLARAMDSEASGVTWERTAEEVAIDRLNPNNYSPAPRPALDPNAPADPQRARMYELDTIDRGGVAYSYPATAGHSVDVSIPQGRALTDTERAELEDLRIKTATPVSFTEPDSATAQAGLSPIVVPFTEQTPQPVALGQQIPASTVQSIEDGQLQQQPSTQATAEPGAQVERAGEGATTQQAAPAEQAPTAVMAPSGRAFGSKKVAAMYAKQQGMTDHTPVQVSGGWALQPTASTLGGIGNAQAMDDRSEASIVARVQARTQQPQNAAAEATPQAQAVSHPQGQASESLKSRAAPLAIVSNSGKPFATAKAAALHIQAKGIQGATVSKVDGGYVIEAHAEPEAQASAPEQAIQQAPSQAPEKPTSERVPQEMQAPSRQHTPNGAVFTMQGSRRSPDGFKTPGDAVMASERAKRIRPDLDFRVEQKPSGMYMLAGYPRTAQVASTVQQTDAASAVGATPAQPEVQAQSQKQPEQSQPAPAQREQGTPEQVSGQQVEAKEVVDTKATGTSSAAVKQGEGTAAGPTLPTKRQRLSLAKQEGGQAQEQTEGSDRKGAQAVREDLRAAADRGEIPREAADLADWLLQKNPAIGKGLGFDGALKDDGDGLFDGEYDPFTKLFRIANDAESPLVAVHEILHHSETMMPRKVRAGIYSQWDAALRKATVGSSGETRKALALIPMAVAGDKAATQAVDQAFADGVLDSDAHYQLTSPSEYWAVNAARILSERHSADSWIAQARQWIRELITRLKSMATTAQDDAVIAGLQAILDSDGQVQASRTLAAAARMITTPSKGETPARSIRSVQPNGGVGFAEDAGVYTLAQWGRAQQLRADVQDRFLRVKQLQQAIEEVVGEIPETQDVYMAEELSYGRVQAKTDEFKDLAVKPLLQAVNDNKLTLDDVALYSYAVHAPERNAYLKKRGVVDGSGMTNQQAQQILEAFDKSGKAEALAGVHKQLMAITHATRDLQLSEGLITRGQYDAWNRMFKNYVPLKGQVLQDIDPIAGQTVESESKAPATGWEVSGPQSLPALGRKTQASQIVENAVLNYNRAAAQAVKNSIGKALVALADAHPDATLWEFVSESGEGIYSVKMQGQDVHLRIKDEQLLKALKQEGGEIDSPNLSAMMDALGKWTRYSGQVLTRFNPVFGVTNAVKDAQWASAVALAELGPSGAAAFAKHYANLKQSGPAWEEFKASGALTGGFHMGDASKVGEELQAMIEWQQKATPQRLAKDAFESTKTALEWIGQHGENQARFALYKAGRDAGLSVAKAASLSKSSTNFNRRGYFSNNIGAAMMFFNAGVQGAHSFGRLLGNSNFQGYMLGAVSLAAASAVMNASMGGDDDDGLPLWDKISDHEKRNNFIIMLPPSTEVSAATGQVGKTGRYIKIPLAHPIAFLNTVGVSLADMARRGQHPGHGIGPAKAATNIVGAMFGAFNPVGGSFDPTDADEAAIALLPTLPSQIYQLAKGKDAFGRDTVPEKESAKHLPDSEKVTVKGYGGAAHGLARWVNEHTGGTQATPGAIDVAPGTLTHAAEIATGGIGRTAVGVLDLTLDLLGGKEIEPGKAVLAGRFYGEVKQEREVGRFYDLREQVKEVADQAKQARKLHINKEWTEDEMAMIRMGKAVDSVASQLGRLNNQIRKTIDSDALTDKERDLRVKVLQSRKAAIAEKFNQRLAQRLGWTGETDDGGED